MLAHPPDFHINGAISHRETACFGTEVGATAPEIHKDLLQPIDLPPFSAYGLAFTLWSAQFPSRCRLVALSSLVPSLGATLEAIHLKTAKAHMDSTLFLTQKPRPSLTLCSYMAKVKGRKVPGRSPMIRLYIGQRNGFHKILHFKQSGYIALGTIPTGVTRVYSMFMTSPRRSLELYKTAL